MMKLSKRTAQKIAEEMMKVIPYNINVMDEKGIVIGSGDKSRIGIIHDGAIRAIESGVINEIYQEAEGVKPGVNEPIIVNDKVIGVIGITGNPDEVRKFSKLVGVTAVLLIEQAKKDLEIQNSKLDKQKFYNELAHRKTDYDTDFIQKAKNYGIDLLKKTKVVLVEGNIRTKTFKTLSEQFGNYCELECNKIIFFISNTYSYSTLIEKLKESSDVEKIALGQEHENAAIALEKAELILRCGSKLKPFTKIYSYEELEFFINLSSKNKESFVSLFSNLDTAGNKIELLQTLQIYLEENGDINAIARRMNIHRNTLNYRLERIQQLTGKNPKVFFDLFELLCGLLWR
ncbi:helix-turn-helix domain-containing protein [Clostridium swellfunianum]|uniref:CdaR family transcriptional regulator n=1 Tax=Clostridium swellfunianum TaxID=1367462 RepID=UPI00202F3C95|nr:sugar diacid recognition domain-containing protein [Clostridium swellfunianum]MCM0649069.1 helix-turn-helix domain-containing protein [Clostridium swellfunianum]